MKVSAASLISLLDHPVTSLAFPLGTTVHHHTTDTSMHAKNYSFGLLYKIISLVTNPRQLIGRWKSVGNASSLRSDYGRAQHDAFDRFFTYT